MNFIGKTFTVLIFVMAVMFAAFASAFYFTHKNWMTVAAEKSKEKEAAKSELEKALTKKKELNDQIKDERDRQSRDLAKLEHEAVELGKERDKNQTVIAKQEQELLDLIQKTSKMHDRLTGFRKDVARLTEDIRTHVDQRNAKLKELLNLKSELNMVVDELTRLDARKKELLDDLEKARQALEPNGTSRGTRTP
jgi:septal ring factor EnvC (AmiA/AmiB activator)